MKSIKEVKLAQWAAEEAAGALDSSQWSQLGYTKCVNGVADAKPGVAGHQFKCKNTDLYSFMSHSDMGCNVDGTGERGSGSWGWTAPDGREYIAHGCYGGTPLLEITKDRKLVKRGFLTQTVAPGQYSAWKEVRSYKNYMLIGSEREEHGVQIFDMSKVSQHLSTQWKSFADPSSFSQSLETMSQSFLTERLMEMSRAISLSCNQMEACTMFTSTKSLTMVSPWVTGSEMRLAEED